MRAARARVVQGKGSVAFRVHQVPRRRHKALSARGRRITLFRLAATSGRVVAEAVLITWTWPETQRAPEPCASASPTLGAKGLRGFAGQRSVHAVKCMSITPAAMVAAACSQGSEHRSQLAAPCRRR